MPLADSAERLVYRAAGLPVALGVLLGTYGTPDDDPLRSAFARRYWHPESASEWTELLGGIVLWPFGLLLASAWFTWRNGPVIRKRYGKRITAQIREQMKFYFSAGVLPPWYYIFSLHDEGEKRADTFIQRFETKSCYFRVLKPRKGSPLNDKRRFAEFCVERGIRTVETLMNLNGQDTGQRLPDQDLFVKPTTGRGGRGAERWDNIGPSAFAGPAGEQLSESELLSRLVGRSREHPLIVQPRMAPHPDLACITAGALPTTRILTCLNQSGEPEVMAAMIRMSFGKNKTVDNLHAGGIGALVDVAKGSLSRASNLGSDARLGWFSGHPDTGEPIEGRIIPFWEEAKAAAVKAHRHFDDRVVVGWDIAILEDGPIFIEGNGNPDLDILQRFMRIGFREHRLAERLAFHLRERGAVGSLRHTDK
jgi:Sugar-transfer associated ATP-grasp